MIRMSRRIGARSAFSSLAMALALSCGTVALTGIVAPAAVAQDKNSKGFGAAYNAIMPSKRGEDPDWNVVKGQFGTLEAAIENEQDRYIAGQVILQAGNSLTDPSLQRKGLSMMLNSGKVAPEDVGRFQFFVGSLAFNARDYAAARTALQAASVAGFTDQDPRGLIAESYFQEGNAQQGVSYIKDLAGQVSAAGNTVPEEWLLRALQGAYDNNMVDAGTEVALMLVEQHPSAENFSNATQIANGLHDYSPQVQLDLLRLLRLTSGLPAREYSVLYIENADPRIMSNEVVDVLAEALAAGQFQTSDSYYVDVKNIADGRTAQDRADAPGLVTEAVNKSDASSALIAGDVNYSIENFAEAERMYALAAERGGPSLDAALTREGMAQIHQGKYAEAIATLNGVTMGERPTIAALWKAYAASKATPAPPPAPAVTAAPAE